jgi:ABC-2 type transport system permease protein
LTSSELRTATVRLGFLEYRAGYPWPVLLGAEWPRAVLQCLFFTLLGQVTGGADGSRFAFVGALALILTLSTVINLGDVPGTDKWYGTFHRTQLSPVPVGVLFGLRCLPWVADGMVAVVLSALVVGPLTGNGQTAMRLLPALPLFLLMALTSAAAGLAVAAPSLGPRADVLLANGFVYLIMVSGGLVVTGTPPVLLRGIGAVLPLTHGVAAVRAVLDGRPWAVQCLLELLVGVCWAVVAMVAYEAQSRRARRTGSAEFA